MWFRNLQLFDLPADWKPSAGTLEEILSRHPLLAVHAASMESRGWVAPDPASSLVYSQGRQMLIALGIQQRLLPASVIRQVLKDKAAKLETQQGFAPGRKQLRDLKDQVIDELRPRAFVRERSIRAWIDLERGWLAVDSASPKIAEDLLTVLRADVGGLAATPLLTQNSVGGILTGWIISGKAPGALELGDDCELLGVEEGGKASVRYVRHGLDGAEIRSLIKGGKVVNRAGLIWRDRIAFVATAAFALKRIRFELVKEEAASREAADQAAALDAGFALMTGELGALLDDLLPLFGGRKRD